MSILSDRDKPGVGLWVHQAPARSLDQVNDYLKGDDHDRSKVEYFDGVKFWNILDLILNAEEKKR